MFGFRQQEGLFPITAEVGWEVVFKRGFLGPISGGLKHFCWTPTLHETNIAPKQMVVGIRFPVGKAYFQGFWLSVSGSRVPWEIMKFEKKYDTPFPLSGLGSRFRKKL